MKQITNAQYEQTGAAVKVVCLNCSRNYLAEGGTPEYNRVMSGELLAVCPSCSAVESFVFVGGPEQIEVIATLKKTRKGITTGLYEIRIPGVDHHKFVLAEDLKLLAGVRRINHYKRINEWLNTPAGALWITSTKHVTIEEFEKLGSEQE